MPAPIAAAALPELLLTLSAVVPAGPVGAELVSVPGGACIEALVVAGDVTGATVADVAAAAVVAAVAVPALEVAGVAGGTVFVVAPAAALDAAGAGAAAGAALPNGAATVAERTFAVTFPDPAALVVGTSGFAAGLAATAGAAVGAKAGAEAVVDVVGVLLLSAEVLTGVIVAAETVAAGLPGAGEGALLVTVSGLFPAASVDGVLVVTTMVEAAGGVRLLPGCAFCTVTEFAGGALTGAAACAIGTLPEPGVPAPGNTVPCCRLPSFGCAAEGGAEGASAALA